MRARLVSTLVDLAATDDRIVLLTADLGFMVVEPFVGRHPDRFVNVGVAEQNMLSVAVGLAAQGLVPYCYSIATFASMRGYEQWRNGAVLHNLPVRVVGIGGGFAYGPAGPTHHALEDIGLMRVQPALTVVAPADDDQMEAAVRATAFLAGPVYIRATKDSRSFPELHGRFRLGRLEIIGDGEDVLLVSVGGMLGASLEAAELLKSEGLGVTVAVIASISPAPVTDLLDLLARTAACVTVEDHYPTGGIGSLVAEVIAGAGRQIRFGQCAVEPQAMRRTGSEAWLRADSGLSAPAIADHARRVLQRAGSETGISRQAIRS